MFKKGKILKIAFLIIAVFIILYTFFVPESLATTFNTNTYAPTSTTDASNASEIQRIGNIAIGAVRAVASIVSVIVLIVMGIKYLLGSVEEKAEYKKTMFPYVIGALLVFSINIIIEIVIGVAKGIL